MTDTAEIAPSVQTRARTVQEYIDEIPMWPDGTVLNPRR